MKALYFKQHGGFENLEFGIVEDPKVEKDCAIIEILYSSINHLDLWVLKGWKGLRLEMPHIGGSDIVGKISHIESSNKNYTTGQLVCVNPGYIKQGVSDDYILSGKEHLSPRYGILGETCKGGFSHFIKVPIENIRPIPKNSEEKLPDLCASLLVGLTSFRMLKTRAQIKQGDTILVVGSSGGLNSFTVKLAKYFGAVVIALTSSESKENFSKKIGADYVINYKQIPEWHKKVKDLTNGKGVDVVIDNVGQATINQSIRSLKNEGKIVTVGNTSGYNLEIDNRLIFTKQISILGSTMGSFKDFDSVLSLITQKEIYAEISETIPLSEGVKGYKTLETGTQRGKIVFNNLL